jgi:valyl-tRNA synthetase
VIHYLYYPVEGMDKSQWLKVATTRPETILGDTAVAIHPEDERYKAYHGKMAINPMTGRRIPIVLDSQLVNMELGTGVVKVTPAHDPEDYECGLRHNLQFINILNDDGTLNSNAGAAFQTMDRFDARDAVIQALQKEGLYIEKKPNPMKIAVCSRSKDILEPRLKPQWYVRCKEMGAKSLVLVKSGQIEMLPDIFRDEWERWMRTQL